MAGPAQVAPHRNFERQLVASLDGCCILKGAKTADLPACSQPNSSSSSTHRLPGARPRSPADASRPCRRGDRAATLFCCDCSQPLLAPNGHIEACSRMSAFGETRTLMGVLPRPTRSSLTQSGHRPARNPAVQRSPAIVHEGRRIDRVCGGLPQAPIFGMITWLGGGMRRSGAEDGESCSR